MEATDTEAFTLEELFFSTTDERGFIQSSNDVFVRVSKYTIDELIGQPHNVIRHPEMPRVVFRTLWDSLNDGQGIAAYVVNQDKEGDPYWVFAVARPIPGGHLSVRLKPTTELFPVVADLYEQLLAAEKAVEDTGGKRSEAMEASGELLDRKLQELGFPSYDAFMRVAAVAEVSGRRNTIDSTSTVADELGLTRFLDGQLGLVEQYLGLNRHLSERSSSLITLTREASLLGFNVTVAASRLGSDGAPLRALARLMQETGADLVDRASSLARCLDTTRSTLEEVGFSVAVASLQNDMANLMAAEADGDEATGDIRQPDQGTHAGSGAETDASIALMNSCLHGDLDTVFSALRSIQENLAIANDLAQELVRDLRTLDAVTRNGQVEATRTTGAGFFVALFERAQDLVLSGLADSRAIAAAVREFGADEHEEEANALLQRLDRTLGGPRVGSRNLDAPQLVAQ